MNLKQLVMLVQRAMNTQGAGLVVDGDFGPRTEAKTEDFEVTISVKKLAVTAPTPGGARPVNPAYVEAKKHDGKTEYDKTFNGYLSKFWAKVGLPSWKTIVGTSAAWCALFVGAMNSEVGQKYITNGGAAARSYAKYGVEIDYKKNGIPRGAVIHINHNANCNSSASNHVGFADGDCTVADITRVAATFPMFGGNQGDAAKRSNFKVSTICEVRWPSEVPKPGPVVKSFNCLKVEASNESTR